MADVYFETARNSELIFTYQRRHLCSSIQPTREAQAWIAHHQKQWRDCRTIIVLGLGCGYHVRALKMATDARVLVLEPSREVIQAALRVHPLDLNESDLFHLPTTEAVAGILPIAEATKNSYCVLVHEPSAFAHPSLYLETKEFLLGRKASGLRWLFQNRGVEMPAIDETEMNLKTVAPILDRQLAGELPLQPALQALRELIA